MNRPLQFATLLVVAGLAMTVLTAGCSQQPMAAADQSTGSESASASSSAGAGGGSGPSVETVRVETRDLNQTVEMPGTVEGFETADLYAKVGGYLEEISVDIGDKVQKGQVLARLSIPEMEKRLQQRQASVAQARAEVNQAEAAVQQARADLLSAQAAFDEAKAQRAEAQAEVEFRQVSYRRTKRLAQSGSVQQELVDEAKYRLDSAQAALQSVEAHIRTAEARLNGARAHVAKAKADRKAAQSRLDVAQADADYVRTMMEYAEIKAPFDGRVTRRYVHPGAFIQPAEGNSAANPLLTVTRTDTVRIFLDVPMNDVRLLDRGDRAVLSRINVLPGETVEGEVTRFSAAVDAQSRLMKVEVDIENPDGRLRPGYYGYVTVYLEEMPETPVVPSSALLTEGDEEYVYVVRNGRAQRQIVTTNYRDGTWIGIESGLQPGEQVIRAGGGQIQDGQSVRTVLTEVAQSG